MMDQCLTPYRFAEAKAVWDVTFYNIKVYYCSWYRAGDIIKYG